jgi:hypothetical protein
LAEGDIYVDAYIIYGESKKSLERVIDKRVLVESVQILDDALLNITNVVYKTSQQAFIITVENVGKVTAYANGEVVDLNIGEEVKSYASEKIMEVKPGKTADLIVKVVLDEFDQANNENVNINVFYGQSRDRLIKMLKGEYKFLIAQVSFLQYVPIVIIIILVLLIFFAIIKRRKKKEEK